MGEKTGRQRRLPLALLVVLFVVLSASSDAQRTHGDHSDGEETHGGFVRKSYSYANGTVPEVCTEAKALALRLRGLSAADPAYQRLLGKYMELARLCNKALKHDSDPSSSSTGGPSAPGMGPSGARPSVPPTESPLAALLLLAKLPRAVQHELLKKFGEDMVRRGATNCNIFGGKEACIPLSKNSAFARKCVNHPLLVDCAFYDESLGEIDDDPTDDLRAEVEAQHEKPCKGCSDNLDELYCAQAVPMCGTFDTHLEFAVLPALTEIVQAKASGGDFMAVLAGLIPSLAKTTALTAPCRRYCEAITSSCSCGKSQTFGDMLTMLQTGDDPYLPTLPPAVQEQLFAQLNNKPLCELYADENDPGFVGHCPNDDALEFHTCAWCDDNQKVPVFVQEYLADSLLNGIFGWLIGPEGLLAEADIFSGDDDDQDDIDPDEDGAFDEKDEEDYDAASGGRRHGAALALAVFLWLLGLTGVGAAVALAVVVYRRYQEQGGLGFGFGFGGTNRGISYTPMGDFSGDDLGDYAAPDVDSI